MLRQKFRIFLVQNSTQKEKKKNTLSLTKAYKWPKLLYLGTHIYFLGEVNETFNFIDILDSG